MKEALCSLPNHLNAVWCVTEPINNQAFDVLKPQAWESCNIARWAQWTGIPTYSVGAHQL